jgi:VWFA-related protein
VLDRRGRPLLDLKSGDFELDDNGIAQKIVSVELRSISATAGAPIAPIVTEDDERTAARDPDTRLFAVFLDEFNVSAGTNSSRVREAAGRFVADYVRPRDLLCVMKPLGSVTAIRFTRDRAAALAAIESFEGRKGDYAPRTDFEAQYFGRVPAAVESARMQIVTTALREVTMRIGELQSTRAALILATEGLVNTSAIDRRRLPDWQTLGRAASHFKVPIYTLDPRDPPPAPADPGRSAVADRGSIALRALAAQTGGESVGDGQQLLPALARLSRDLDTYYVLTYRPSEATDGRFHPIQVRARREAVEVRTPSGYWSPLSSEWRTWLHKASGPAVSLPTRALRRSPFIDVWYGYERTADGRLQFVFTWDPTAFSSRGRKPPPATVLLRASTSSGTTVFENDVRAASAASDGDVARARGSFQIAGGRLQLDLTIRAADGTVVDTAAQDIDVPVFRGEGPVLLPPQLVRARTAREFRDMVSEITAPPSPSREFSRAERLALRVPAFNPDGAPVTIAASIVNLRGQRLRELQQISPSGWTGLPQFDLPLSFLAPGEYGVEVQVSSATGTARQLIRFRLVG